MSEVTPPAEHDPRRDQPNQIAPGPRPARGNSVEPQPRNSAVRMARRGPRALLQSLVREIRRLSLGLLASLAVHLVVLVLLAIYVIHQTRDEDLVALLGGFRTGRAARTPASAEPVTIAPVAPVAVNGNTRKNSQPAGDSEIAPVATRRPAEVVVTGALSARLVTRSAEQLRVQGGSEETELAVRRGLAWLAQVQRPDGHWQLHTGYPDAGEIRTDTGATALALLCFLGAGQTHQSGEHSARVARGLDWLKRIQKQGDFLKGDFFDSNQEGENASFYAHAQATMALTEALVLTGDESLRQPVLDGLAFIAEGQHPRTGGWKYRRGSAGDLSVFGWQIMALQTGRMAGIEPPPEILDRANGFLELVQSEGGTRYRYEPASRAATPAMTAEGLLCRQYLGWPREHPAFGSGGRYLLEDDHLPRWESGRRNVYLWYYAAQMLHNLQGADWDRWNALVRTALVRNQVTSGARVAGSWNPRQPVGHPDENVEKGGRLYLTALCLLTLEVYYRHLPLYRDAEGAVGGNDQTERGPD
jgi:hypothetical protein